MESEKALKKYPNCFGIVYQSAVIYSEKGYEQKDKKASSRALELFDMACSLIEQNTDENISELSIRRQMARLHLSLGHADACVDMLKKMIYVEFLTPRHHRLQNFGFFDIVT